MPTGAGGRRLRPMVAYGCRGRQQCGRDCRLRLTTTDDPAMLLDVANYDAWLHDAQLLRFTVPYHAILRHVEDHPDGYVDGCGSQVGMEATRAVLTGVEGNTADIMATDILAVNGDNDMVATTGEERPHGGR